MNFNPHMPASLLHRPNVGVGIVPTHEEDMLVPSDSYEKHELKLETQGLLNADSSNPHFSRGLRAPCSARKWRAGIFLTFDYNANNGLAALTPPECHFG